MMMITAAEPLIDFENESFKTVLHSSRERTECANKIFQGDLGVDVYIPIYGTFPISVGSP